MISRKMILLLLAALALIGATYVVTMGLAARPAVKASQALPPGDSQPAAQANAALLPDEPRPVVQAQPPDPPQAAGDMKTTAQVIDFWAERVQRDPRDFISLGYLGQAYSRRARETGDVADYDKAEKALRQALTINPTYEDAQTYLAAVLYSRHDFAGALQLAQQVYTADPRAAQALATMGDAQLELGNYDEAQRDYEDLANRAPSAGGYARLARLAWLQGRPDEAIDQMQKAVDQTNSLELTGEGAAWYELQLGELYFNTGKLDQAERHYDRALQLFDHYYLALAGLGKVRAAQGQLQEAIRLYEQAAAIIPHPDVLAALGDLYQRTGQVDQARHQYDTVEFIGKLAAINQVVYNRQLALFEANHDRKVDEALTLASREAQVRKDIYAYDTLAWALYKNGRYPEAASAMQQAMRLGTRDAMLYYHAGMIEAGLGHAQAARDKLAEALAINPHFDFLQSQVARDTLDRLPGS